MTQAPGIVSRETEAALDRLNVSRETRDRLTIFATQLLRWNGRINLIGRKDEINLWQRHILDSLQLIPLVPAGTDRAIDLGSGGGFPGLVVAIATGIHFDLIESDQRKCAFLREAANATGTKVVVSAARIESARIEPSPLVTARALAPLDRLLALAYPFAAQGKKNFLFPKGLNVEDELTGTQAAWNMRVERFPSQTQGGGVILRLTEVSPRE